MSTILSLKQAPAETLDLLVARPELAIVFWMNPDYTPPKTPALLVWIAKLLGHYEPPLELPEAPAQLVRNGEELHLEDRWEELSEALGLFDTGVPIKGSSHGYGDEQAFRPAEAESLDQSLQQPEAVARVGCWDDDLRDEFKRLQEFLNITTTESLGLVAKIS